MRPGHGYQNDKLLLLPITLKYSMWLTKENEEKIHSDVKWKYSKEVKLVRWALTFLPPAGAILSRGPK